MARPSPDSAPTPTEEEIGEDHFAALLEREATAVFGVLDAFSGRSATEVVRSDFGALVHECHELESFLDDHGARLNRRFATFTEIVASLRSFAITGYSLSHLAARAERYGIANWSRARGVFEAALDSARSYVLRSTSALGEGLRSEAKAAGLEPTGAADALAVHTELRRVRLPHDIGQDRSGEDPQRVAELVTRFIQATEMLTELGVRQFDSASARRAYVAQFCREEQARVYEATVHNLQSTYDTHIKNTALESSDDRLHALRGYASAALHLLEGVTQLAHFHERHESDVGPARAAQLLTSIADPDEVQAVLVNDLLFAATAVLEEGRDLAEALLVDYTHVRELFVELPPGVVLHARPVALIVGIVAHFGTPVEVEIGPKRCNAGSILEVLMALGSAPGASAFVFRGDERPLAHIALLFEHDLGEGTVSALPDELRYLRAD